MNRRDRILVGGRHAVGVAARRWAVDTRDARTVRQVHRRRGRWHDGPVDVARDAVGDVAARVLPGREEHPAVSARARRVDGPKPHAVGPESRAGERRGDAHMRPLAVLSRAVVDRAAEVRTVDARPRAHSPDIRGPRAARLVQSDPQDDALGRVNGERVQLRPGAARAEVHDLNLGRRDIRSDPEAVSARLHTQLERRGARRRCDLNFGEDALVDVARDGRRVVVIEPVCSRRCHGQARRAERLGSRARERPRPERARVGRKVEGHIGRVPPGLLPPLAVERVGHTDRAPPAEVGGAERRVVGRYTSRRSLGRMRQEDAPSLRASGHLAEARGLVAVPVDERSRVLPSRVLEVVVPGRAVVGARAGDGRPRPCSVEVGAVDPEEAVVGRGDGRVPRGKRARRIGAPDRRGAHIDRGGGRDGLRGAREAAHLGAHRARRVGRGVLQGEEVEVAAAHRKVGIRHRRGRDGLDLHEQVAPVAAYILVHLVGGYRRPEDEAHLAVELDGPEAPHRARRARKRGGEAGLGACRPGRAAVVGVGRP